MFVTWDTFDENIFEIKKRYELPIAFRIAGLTKKDYLQQVSASHWTGGDVYIYRSVVG